MRILRTSDVYDSLRRLLDRSGRLRRRRGVEADVRRGGDRLLVVDAEVLLHLDSVNHEKIMEAIEMCGRYVIPHFNDKNNVVRPTEEILEKIRAMRPQK